MSQTDDQAYYIGVDVGTGSARAGVFDPAGQRLATAKQDIQMWQPQEEFFEQSSEDIWQACCNAVMTARQEAGLKPEQIKGIGFDATCSLVALDRQNCPVTISLSGNPQQNVIVWMDHRATTQTDRINQTHHEVLKYVGGTLSPEMQSPKLLWIKENLPAPWQQATQFLDLTDYLTYRATGDATRSFCTTVAKWTYQGQHQDSSAADPSGWDDSYWRQIGLGELVDAGYRRIGTQIRPMGTPLAAGLTEAAARDLGLHPGTAVGVGLIDAYAGALGMMGTAVDGETPTPESLVERLALICGTSSCHIALAQTPHFIPGIWGPYFSALLPGLWNHEGGQSAVGALIDHVIASHPSTQKLHDCAQQTGQSVYEVLNQRLDELAATVAFPALLTRDLHVFPDFHGNRSPHADSTLQGMISGLTLSSTLDSLAVLYLATIQAIAYETREIITAMNANGYRIKTIFACGGNTKNPVFLREHADITGCRMILPGEPETVLLGAAMLGAVAAGEFPSLSAAMTAMSHIGEIIEPQAEATAQYHTDKYSVFQKLYQDQISYRTLMARWNH